MSVLRNLEAKLEGLVEGAFSRAFKSKVQPVEIARKLAKEMEDNKTVSLSRTYVPNQYLVYLSPEGPAAVRGLRGRPAEGAVGLPARARPRARGWRSLTRPTVEFRDRRPARPRRVRHPGDARRRRPRRAQAEAVEADFGHTMVYSPTTRRAPARVAAGARRRARCSSAADKRTVLSGSRFVIGRSRDCDLDARRPERLAPPRRAAPRGRRLGGRRPRLDQRHQGQRPARGRARSCSPATRSRSGLTQLTFERE